ncbi:glycosyltransferase [bacterium]|nr:glycosyltransferase [bacterium]
MSERKRRFVHVFASFAAGGAQVRAVQLMHHQGSACEHIVMALDGNTDARQMLSKDIEVSYVAPPKDRRFFAMRKKQVAWLREQDADLVLTYNWGSIESVAAARKLKLPLVHHEDGFGPEEADKRLLRRSWMRRWLLRGVPVIVPSTVLQDIATKEWHLRPSEIHHLANGVDLQHFKMREHEPTTPIVGTVGGLRREKDHGNLLRAIAKMSADVSVSLVGSGSMETQLREQSQQLGIADRVFFAGQTTDTADSYRGFTVFALSSCTEQMPIAMLEGMATGLPIVTTNVGDVAKMLPEEQLDYIVPREDSEALAKALTTVLADAELRQRLGTANRRLAEQRYDSKSCLDRFCAVYQQANRRSPRT